MGGGATGQLYASYDPAVPWQLAIPFSALPLDEIATPEQKPMRFAQLAMDSLNPAYTKVPSQIHKVLL